MRTRELLGNRILNNCLPTIKYSVNFNGDVSATENIGMVRYTHGKDTPGSRRFLTMLTEKGLLLDFITRSFSGNATQAVRVNRVISIGSWVSLSFDRTG